MSHYGTEAQRVRAQAALDNSSPPEMSDEDELIEGWIEACPVSLTVFGEASLRLLLEREVDRD